MTESTPTLEPFFDDVNDDLLDASDGLSEVDESQPPIDARRRLEEMLELRSLEKDVREFDFDV